MRSIAKLISNFKNSKTHREQGGLTKQNLTKINNVYSKLPERNNISTLGMEYLKKEKEDFIKLRQKHFSVMSNSNYQSSMGGYKESKYQTKNYSIGRSIDASSIKKGSKFWNKVEHQELNDSQIKQSETNYSTDYLGASSFKK